MVAIPSGADDLANTLLTSLIAGKDFTVPEVNLDDLIFAQPETEELPVEEITVEDLTTGQVDGTGVFDKLMTSLVNHLRVEFEANRISGAEYTKAYIGVVGAVLQTASQFLLGKDQAYWQAILAQKQALVAQIQATAARIELETAKAALVRMQFEAASAEAGYGLVKMKISTEDATYAHQVAQTAGTTFTTENLLPKQKELLGEQVEVQRAQTLDTRTDEVTPVAGAVGKQKELYTQQITSYQRDAETKFVKIFSDAWITQKTIDEGLLAPSQFTNAEINEVLLALRGNLGLGG